MFFEIGGDNMDSKRVVIELLVGSSLFVYFFRTTLFPAQRRIF